jgi:hypothetical protein
MTAMTPSRFGQVNQAGATDALFLKVFSGEVLAAFEVATVMQDKVQSRSISSGKSASFPVHGRTTAAIHTPGADILGTGINANEKVITIDGLTVASAFVANIDEAMNHYDVRGLYSTELGRALARAMDSNLQQVGLLAARAAANVSDAGYPGGTVQTNAGYGTTGATLAGGLFDAAKALDQNNNPEDDRYAVFKPAQYYLLAQTTAVIDRDWGGSGSYAEGKVLRVAGISLVKSNQLPTTNVVSGPAAYQGNFSTTVGLVLQKGAIGMVKLMDLAMEAQYLIKTQGTLMVAKYATGYGILRPESAVEMKTA